MIGSRRLSVATKARGTFLHCESGESAVAPPLQFPQCGDNYEECIGAKKHRVSGVSAAARNGVPVFWRSPSNTP